MTTNASRAPVDFDAFARDLQPAPRPAQPKGDAKGDPLAELARIVGQDDPFRALLEARDSRAGAAVAARGGRVEPTFYDAPPAQTAQPQHAASSADAFDQYLASVEQNAHSAGHEPAPHDAQEFAGPEFAADDAAHQGRMSERPRGRSRLVSVGAGLGVLALCVTGALTWRGLQSDGSSGAVPTILADKAPLKIAPKTADGVEIPDQNKQIYDRTAKDGQIRIVNREEQPIDVTQAAKPASRGAESGATPAAGAPQVTLTESLGEPRRVRTVSVKPDGPPAPAQRQPAEVPAEGATATPASVIPTMTLPGASTDGTATTASLRRSVKPPLPAATPAPVVEAASPVPVVPAPAPAPRIKATQRVASVAPESTAALAAPPATVAATPSPVGGFSVQLGVRTSEGEAKAAFRQMQEKYAQLGGQPALIRQAEVNGKTIYRVRVGPLGKTEATSLCTQLQGAGGQCFVAKN